MFENQQKCLTFRTFVFGEKLRGLQRSEVKMRLFIGFQTLCYALERTAKLSCVSILHVCILQ